MIRNENKLKDLLGQIKDLNDQLESKKQMEIKFEVKKLKYESEMSVLNDQIRELKDQLSSKIQSEIKQNCN